MVGHGRPGKAGTLQFLLVYSTINYSCRESGTGFQTFTLRLSLKKPTALESVTNHAGEGSHLEYPGHSKHKLLGKAVNIRQ